MTNPISELSARQRQILELISSGTASSKQLSKATSLSPGYIDKTLSQAAKTLGSSDRMAAARRYQELLESSDLASDPRSPELSKDAENGPTSGASSIRRALQMISIFLSGPPLGGEQHSLRWDQIVLQILRVAAIGLVSITTLALFILGLLRTFS